MANKHYPDVNPNPDFPSIEKEILAYWQKNGMFQRSIDTRPATRDGHNNEFIFYDGPPFANGLPHYGHLLTGFVKDMFARYETMKGKRVERRFGWDCHGLPAEMGSEKELGISGRNAIINYGIGKFNDHCRASVMKYAHEWETYVNRQARWVDFKNDYKTMDTNFMESVLWAFSQLHKKGLIYEAYRVMPYSWAAETPLSNFETKLDNSYREREDKAITVAFQLKTKPKGAPDAHKYYACAWTTTPWTLPSNLALAVGKDIHYTHTIVGNACYFHSAHIAKSIRKALLPQDIVLETPHFYLREFKENDFPLFATLMADKEVNALIAPVDKSLDDPALVRQLFDGMLSQYKKDGFSKWAVFEKGTHTFAGRAGINKVVGREDMGLIEVGYILNKEFWGKGHATELAAHLYDYAFTSLGLEEVSSLCHPDNKPSAAVMQKFGLKYTDNVFYPFLGDERTRYKISREHYFKLNAIKGKDLTGLSYKPLFPYFEAHKEAFKILDGSSFVTDTDGTGIVHMAPGFGEEDQKCCEANGIEVVVPVDGQGKYTSEIYDLPQQFPAPKEAVLATERLYVRPFRADEFTLYHALQADPKVAGTTSDGVLPEEKIRAEFDRLQRDQTAKGFTQWAVFRSEDNTFVGRAGFDNRSDYDAFNTTGKKGVELRYAFLSDYWGKGYASEIAASLIDWAIGHLKPEIFIAGCNPTYAPAVSLLKKLGFTSYQNVQFRNQPVFYHDMLPAHWQSIRKNAAPLSLKGMNVIAETNGQRADEPYKPEQVKKYGLANLRIIQWLKENGKLIKQEEIKHNYPHCWRTDQPLIYRAMPSWYVEVTKFRDRAVKLNEQINWIPSHIRDGQMGHMLATAPDWSISRNRFWGTPIPVWRSDNPKNKELYVFGSIAELNAFFNANIKDLHRPFIDELTKPDPYDAQYTLRRVEDVFDCWFESGSMPFAQVHYPFENKDWFENHFPADFITEYVGQTRGWFNTLIMLSTALFDKPPFKNCICHGVVLDAETGLKYSKRLKNYKDPLEVINVFGADALRWLMIASPVMRGMDLMVDPEGKFIRDVVRLAIKPIWNAYNFFVLYANSDGIKAKFATDSQDVMDRYILAKCKQAVEAIQTSLDAYDTPGACDAVMQFFEALNNWYIRRNKERFWKSEHDADKQSAYDTLYTVLTTMCRAAAPLLPLTLDDIYRGLTGEESVHLANFPTLHTEGVEIRWGLMHSRGIINDEQLICEMDWVRNVCNAALAIRSKLNIRVRQPLAGLEIVYTSNNADSEVIQLYYGYIVLDEVNGKAMQYSNIKDFIATLKLSINSAVLGKRLPDKMKQILPASKKGEWKQVNGTVEIAGEKLLAGEYTLQLEPKPEYKDRAQALSTNDALVILDTTITPELEAEGIARDLVRMIQQARKDAALNVSDRIHLHLDAPENILKAATLHRNYIMEQTLTIEFSDKKPEHSQTFGTTNAMDDQQVTISLVKAA